MKLYLIIISLLALLIPGALLAQDELTLESLSEALTALAETVSSLDERVAALESLTADPWSPEVLYTDDGICQSPLHGSGEYGWSIVSAIHQATADTYRAAYGASLDTSNEITLLSISFAVDGNKVYLEYKHESSDRVVVETWANCEYLGHSDWQDQE